jgi:hypothetical protein
MANPQKHNSNNSSLLIHILQFSRMILFWSWGKQTQLNRFHQSQRILLVSCTPLALWDDQRVSNSRTATSLQQVHHIRMPLTIVSGAHNCVGKWTDGKGYRMLAYLPTAHIYGFVFELTAQYWGSVIGYARIRTLTDTSVRNCKGDLREFQPQFLTSYVDLMTILIQNPCSMGVDQERYRGKGRRSISGRQSFILDLLENQRRNDGLWNSRNFILRRVDL